MDYYPITASPIVFDSSCIPLQFQTQLALQQARLLTVWVSAQLWKKRYQNYYICGKTNTDTTRHTHTHPYGLTKKPPLLGQAEVNNGRILLNACY